MPSRAEQETTKIVFLLTEEMRIQQAVPTKKWWMLQKYDEIVLMAGRGDPNPFNNWDI